MDPKEAYIDEYFEIACRVEYYRAYRDHCRRWTNGIELFLHATSLSTVGGWAFAQHLGALWAGVLIAAELTRYFRDFIPVFARHKKLTDAIPAMREIHEQAEAAIYSVITGKKDGVELSDARIADMTVGFRQRRVRVEDVYFGEVGLPPRPELAKFTAEAVKIRLEKQLGGKG